MLLKKKKNKRKTENKLILSDFRRKKEQKGQERKEGGKGSLDKIIEYSNLFLRTYYYLHLVSYYQTLLEL